MPIRCPSCHAHFSPRLGADSSVLQCPSCRKRFTLADDEVTQDAIPAATTLQEPQPIPDYIGRFHLQSRLGAGGAGQVWLATDTSDKSQVVIKLGISSRGAGQGRDQRYEQFCHEAAIGAKLQHPNIVRVLEAGMQGTSPYLVSEYVRGHTLLRWLLSRTPSPRQAAKLCVKIANALEYAHNVGVIHRDLKPSNILLDVNEEPHLFDFGVAIDTKLEGYDDGSFIGTPAYMAPEQLDSTIGVIDCRTDIYALGLILYELLTRRRPFADPRDRDQPTPTTRHNPKIPAQLDAICMKCLSKLPAGRFASAGEVSLELTRYLVVDAGHESALKSSDSLESKPDDSPEVRKLKTLNLDLLKTVGELKQMMVAMTAEHELYRSLFASLPIGVFRKDLNQRIVYANQEFGRIVGLPPDQIKGKTARDLFDAELAERQQADDAKVIATGRVLESQETLVTEDDVRTFEVLRSPSHNFDDSIEGVQGMMWDVSAHTKAEEALRFAKQKADDASQAKTNFLANMSHEMRTPMTAINGYADLLLEDDSLSPQQRERADHIRQAGSSLLELISGILDIARIEAGKMEFKRSTFQVENVLENTRVMFEDVARNKNLRLDFEIDPKVPTHLVGDPGRLGQVLQNLVGNALKFTKHGAVSVKVRPRSDTADPEKIDLLFVVKDTGMGIPGDKLDTIFTQFEQVDASMSRAHGGVGLGLAIARHLVKLMDGKIAVSSAMGAGSIFEFNVILTRSQEPDDETDVAPSHPAPQLRDRLLVLVVEDDPSNQKLAQTKLQKNGHTVMTAECGDSALRLIEKHNFDIILMDVQMGGMDGIEATKRIRQMERAGDKTSVPIIAATAHAMKEDQDRCLAAGMNGYVTKPYHWDDIFETMSQLLGKSQLMRQETPETHANEFSVSGDAELLGTFIRVSADYVQEIGDAVSHGDNQLLKRSSHKLKGALANLGSHYGIDVDVDHVARLESMGDQGRAADAVQLHGTLTEQIERLHGQLRSQMGDND